MEDITRRNDALEEAAKICETLGMMNGKWVKPEAASACAEAIRAAKTP